MNINCYVVKPIGFCFGVNRAIDMARQSLKLYKKLYVTEDIAHNKIIMQEMTELGVIKVFNINDVPFGSAFMISAHGVAPDVQDQTQDFTTIDGTCPTVKFIQNQIHKAVLDEKKIIIIGNRTHQEIIGYIGYANNKNVFVVYNEIDIDLLPSFTNDKVICFSQTTLNHSILEKIIFHLKQKIPNLEFATMNISNFAKFGNTCNAIKERQIAIQKIAEKIDVFIVVGSTTSENCKTLVHTATKYGAKKVVLVDSKNNIDIAIFDNVLNIAIAAGASTPEFMVQEIVQFLQDNITDIKIIET